MSDPIEALPEFRRARAILLRARRRARWRRFNMAGLTVGALVMILIVGRALS